MATALAGASIVGGTVNIVGSTVIQNIQQNINMIHQYAITMIREVSRNVSENVSRSTQATIGGLSRIAGKVGDKLVDISKYTTRFFYKVIKDISTSPSGLMLAIITYKTINLAVPCSPDPYERLFRNIENSVDSISISTISLHRIDLPLDKWATAIKEKMEEYESYIEQLIKHIGEYDVEAEISRTYQSLSDLLTCNPPEWHNLGGWIGYAGCILRAGLIHLGLLFYRIGLYIWKYLALGGLYIILYLLRLMKIITYYTLLLLDFIGEKILEFAMRFVEFIVNGVIWFVNSLINVFIKIPVKFVVRFIIKPIVLFVVGVLRWLKDNLSKAICWYIRASPLLISTSTMINAFSKGNLMTGIVGALLSGLGTGIMVNMLIPECKYQPSEDGSLLPPAETGVVPYIPITSFEKQFTSMIRLESSTSQDIMKIPSKFMRSYISITSTSSCFGQAISTRTFISAVVLTSHA